MTARPVAQTAARHGKLTGLASLEPHRPREVRLRRVLQRLGAPDRREPPGGLLALPAEERAGGPEGCSEARARKGAKKGAARRLTTLRPPPGSCPAAGSCPPSVRSCRRRGRRTAAPCPCSGRGAARSAARVASLSRNPPPTGFVKCYGACVAGTTKLSPMRAAARGKERTDAPFGRGGGRGSLRSSRAVCEPSCSSDPQG